MKRSILSHIWETLETLGVVLFVVGSLTVITWFFTSLG